MLRNVTKGRGSNETAEPDIAKMARPMTHLPHRPASGRILSAYSLVAPTGDQVHSSMMAAKRLRTRTQRAGQRHFHNQAFQKFTDTTQAGGYRGACSFTVPPLHQPHISRKKRLQKHDERSAIHLSHAGSDQDLSAFQEGIG